MEFSRRARWWFAQRGINITAALTDNGSCYRSHLWRDELKTSGLKHRRTRPYRPQTNGKGASSGSTGPCAMSGHTSARTAQRPNGDKHLQTGSTPTTITGATPQSAATHPSPASTTSQGITTSRRIRVGCWPNSATLQDRPDSGTYCRVRGARTAVRMVCPASTS